MAQAIAPSVDAGRIQRELERKETPSTAYVVPPKDSQEQSQATIPEGAEDVLFFLRKIVIEGATEISQEEIELIYADKLNSGVSLADIYTITHDITALYRSKGYVLARAILPEQEITDAGIIHIHVIEGFVSDYKITSDVPVAARKPIEALAKSLKNSGVLKSGDLERYLLLMNDIAGVRVRGVLEPSPDVPEGVNVNLIVDERKYQGMASFDNYGNAYIGPERLTVSGSANSLMRSGDQVSLMGLWAPDNNETQYFSAGYQENIGSEGTKWAMRASYTKTDPTLPLLLGGILEPEGTAWNFNMNVMHPFVRSRAFNVNGNVSLDVSRNKTDYAAGFGAIETQDDQRVLRVGSNLSYVDRLAGFSSLSATLSQGVPILGSSQEGDAQLTRPDGDPGFTKLNFDASRIQRLGGPFTGLIAVSGQTSFDSLLASEEFGFGGNEFGRGYDSSEITGDEGLSAKLEIAYTGQVENKYVQDYQVYTFYDIGATWNHDPSAGQSPRMSGASTGIGGRIGFASDIRGEAFIAKPLTQGVTSRGNNANDWRMRAGISASF